MKVFCLKITIKYKQHLLIRSLTKSALKSQDINSGGYLKSYPANITNLHTLFLSSTKKAKYIFHRSKLNTDL